MITLAPLGGGHQSMARAIKEALLELDPAVAVSTVNVFSGDCSAFPMTAIPRLYALFTRKLTMMWRSLYFCTNGRTRYTLVERLAQPMIRPKLRRLLQTIQPDIVISVFPALGYTIKRAIQELGWRIPIGIVVADLVDIHHAWLYRGASWYAVPTYEAQQACVMQDINPEAIHIFGLPVGRDFCRKAVDKQSFRHNLDLPTEGDIVLITGGGEGVGQVETTVHALLASGLPCHLVVVSGRNERLRRRLAQKIRNRPCNVLGYVTNMADWMLASDVLVTKAGPSTIIEAVHCGLPMVLTGAIPGQEEGNISFVVASRLGMVATEPEGIVASIARLLNNREFLAEIKKAMSEIRRPYAALDIARLTLASVHQRVSHETNDSWCCSHH
jgi:1,2-diacylglycerol 3-beta-galactosyltransferase